MPTYEYACDPCETEFTVEKSITDESATPCPSCDSEETRRQISRTSFVLKGGGWYEDGYGSSGASSSEKSASSDSPEGASSSEKSASSDSPEGASSSDKSASSENAKSTPASSAAGASAGSDD